MKLSADVLDALACPSCGGPLTPDDGQFRCHEESRLFPIVDGVPILISNGDSVFSTEDFVESQRTTFERHEPRWKRLARRVVPVIGLNLKGKEHNEMFRSLLTSSKPKLRLLVLGAGNDVEGLRFFFGDASIELIFSDVYLGPDISLVCDAHALPFRTGTIDGVIAHAVLEHVADPHRCVDEIHRVLTPDGVVYADTPFMQQVHAGRFDFERFTHLGHRRLFRHFDEVESGASSGPGTALAWAYCYFLVSFVGRGRLRHIMWALGSFTSFFLKYFDHLLIDRPGALDAASSFYFIGRRAETPVTDRELINSYRGAI